MSQLALYLLEPPRVELDGEPVHIGRRKLMALLVYLAVTNKRHSRETLAAFLAPEFDAAGARADLRRTLSLLNSVLGEGWMVADRETVELRQARDAGAEPDGSRRVLWLDVEAFRQRLAKCDGHPHPLAETCVDCLPLLKAAVGLYQGDFLAGFTLPSSLPFEEWQRFETEALRRELASALERLVRGLSAQEDDEAAIPYALRWLELNLTHEPAHRALMELYARTGQTSVALHQYEYCVQTLAEELGVPPSAETVALYEQVRAGQAGELYSVASSQAQHTAEVPHNLPPQATPFVGREEELADLDQLIADPAVRLITIAGPGGVGKTRLALAAAERQLNQPAGSRVSESTDHSPAADCAGHSPAADCTVQSRTALGAGPRTHPFPHGVFFVPLAPLDSAEHIVRALADALDFQFEDSRPPQQQILDFLRRKQMLLILDNFEHLLSPPLPSSPEGGKAEGVGGGESVVGDILEAAPEVQLLVTSRERLQLQGEQTFAVHGLSLPPFEGPGVPATDADPTEYEAVELFFQSARRVQHDFALASGDLCHLTRICQLVEGMPLGIELAASWVDALSLPDIAAEIQKGSDFLETEWRGIPARHRSMRAVFDASWRQLGQPEQNVFAQLSVFRGGFTREAAQSVATTQDGVPAPLRLLARLANKSFLTYDQGRDRYQVHELLRQYGAEKLARNPAVEKEARDRHCAFYCAALQRWEADLKGGRQRVAAGEIQATIENIRAAQEWAVSQQHFSRLGQALDGLCLFYARPFRPRSGGAVCEAVVGLLGRVAPSLAASGDGLRVLVKALAWQAFFMSQGGVPSDPRLRKSLALLDSPALADQDTRPEQAFVYKMLGFFDRTTMRETAELEVNARFLEKSVALWRELGDQWQLAHTLALSANVHTSLRAFEQAQEEYATGLALFRALNEQWMVAYCLRKLGRLAGDRGDYVEAKRLLCESLELSQRQGDQGGMNALTRLCQLALDQGDYQSATDCARQYVSWSREAGNPHSLTIALGMLMEAVWSAGDWGKAYAAIEEALVIAQELAIPRLVVWIALRRQLLDLHRGRYLEAQVLAQETLAVTREMGEQYWISRTLEQMGLLALVKGQLGAARQYLEESVAALQQASVQERMPIILAALGLTKHRLKNRPQARKHVCRALETAAANDRPAFFFQSLPFIAATLADAEDVSTQERAVELYALSMSDPPVANSQLIEDVAGKHVATAAANLAPETVVAAQERGRALAWRETAEALQKALQVLD